MKFVFLFIFTLCSAPLFAQNGYDCFNQSRQKANWEYLGPVNNNDELAHQRFGHVSCISVNPQDTNEIFIGSPTGALWHTINRGTTWHALTDNTDLPIIGINDLIVDYNKKPYTILISTGSKSNLYASPHFGIFKSTNGGKSWKRSKTPSESVFSEVYYNFIQTEHAIYCRSQKSIVKSTDGGDNWQTVLGKQTIVGGHPLKDRELRHYHYEASQEKIYFSTAQKHISTGHEAARIYTLDLKTNTLGELTNKLIASYQSGVAQNGFAAIQIVPMGSNKLIFATSYFNSKENIFYEYDITKNEVINYEGPNARNLGSSFYWFDGLTLNKKNSNIRYIAGIYLYKSEDGGQHYNRMFDYSYGDNNVPHVDIRSMLITKYTKDGKGDHIYLGTDGGLSFSNDGGKTFKNLNGQEVQLTQFYGLGSSPFTGAISAGSQDNSIMTYLPNQKKWIHNVRGDGYDVAYAQHKPGLVYGQYNNGALGKAANDIVPFSSRPGRILPKGEPNNRKSIVSHPNGDLFFAAKSLFRLPKGEDKWIEYKTPLTHKTISIAVSQSNPKVLYLTGHWNQLIKTTDGGLSWENVHDKVIVDGHNYSKSRFESVCVSPYDEDRIWVGLGFVGSYDNLCNNTARVLESRDGGNTWSDVSAGLPVFSVQDIVFYQGSYDGIFAATDQGVYYRKGTGFNWQRYSHQLPNMLICELNINYCRGKLIAAGYGRGLWESDLPKLTIKNEYLVKKSKTLTAPKGEALVINQDIKLKRKAKLTIDCPVYLPKGAKISARNKDQIIISPNGKVLNGCGEEWRGIVEK